MWTNPDCHESFPEMSSEIFIFYNIQPFTKLGNLTEIYYVPPNRRGGGHIVFGVDPVGVGVRVRVASFPDVIFWTDGRILTKLAQVHCCEGGTSWLDFGDLGPIFKVTATFFNVWNFVSGHYLLNQWTDFDQTCMDTMYGGCEELIRFWWPWPNFQGHSDLL